MNSSDFWESINEIIRNDFTPEGLAKLERYAEQFIRGQLVYKRFSPVEQYGCSTGGVAHVIASLLAGAKTVSNNGTQGTDCFKKECQYGEEQAAKIEKWARAVKVWVETVDEVLPQTLGMQIAEGGEAKVYDNGTSLVKSIGLDYFIQPVLALDRISLHNAYFPETRLTVNGFGRTKDGEFKIIVEQPFIEGYKVTDAEIANFMRNMDFKLINPRNWTYATPSVYLSDMHDENVIKSSSGTIFVIDCDIRINTPQLKCGGKRILSSRVEFR